MFIHEPNSVHCLCWIMFASGTQSCARSSWKMASELRWGEKGGFGMEKWHRRLSVIYEKGSYVFWWGKRWYGNGWAVFWKTGSLWQISHWSVVISSSLLPLYTTSPSFQAYTNSWKLFACNLHNNFCYILDGPEECCCSVAHDFINCTYNSNNNNNNKKLNNSP